MARPSWHHRPHSLPTWVHAKTASASDAVAYELRRLFWCQWIRRLPIASFANCSRTGRRNAWPAEVDQRSLLPAFHTTKDGQKPLDWVRARREGKADGHQGKMHFRMREAKSSRDTQWSRRICCGIEGKDRAESRCCYETL